jgi:hypothetical protein
VAIATVATMALSAPAAPAEPIPQPQRPQLRHFGFFHTPPEGLPPSAPILPDPEVTGFLRGCAGLNPRLAQKVEGVPSRRVFVTPGDGCLSLMDMGPVEKPFPVLSGTVSTADAIKHGILGSRVGVVPDGVIAVTLSRELTVPVKGSAYTFSWHSSYLTPFFKKPRLVFGASATGG